MTSKFNNIKSQKFWRLEWILFGLMAFILNLYFFLVNASQNSYLFTFIAIAITIVIVTIKLYDNESIRKKVLHSIDELPSKVPDKINIEEIFDIEEIKETTYPIFHKTLGLKKDLRKAMISKYADELKDILSMELPESNSGTKVEGVIFRSFKTDKKWFTGIPPLHIPNKDSSDNAKITVVFYNLLLSDYMEYLKEEEDIFSEKRISEFLKDESSKLAD